MAQNSIADASRPNPGRIYDYMLGGGHNFEVDREVAERLMKLFPYGPKYARLQRWSLRTIAEELSCKRGFDVIIDFASGLPTNGHIHFNVSSETTVIYSDHDSITVEYAQEILKNTPNVRIFKSDAGRPDELLNNPEVQEMLNGRRKVAFVMWGVSGFLSDDALSYAAQTLYDWAAPGSCLAFNSQTLDGRESDVIQMCEIYKQMGTIIYTRKVEDHSKLLKPWQMEAPGFVSLIKWHGFDESDFKGEDNAAFGPSCGGHGAYLVKP